VVEVPKYESRAVARRTADDVLEALKRGEDFGKLARTRSDGPTSSRNRGGLMETSPGGYGVAEVNRAIESLPIGQVSGVIEGAESFHIVKVEGRRAAGPASFEEVQDRIKPIVQNLKFQTESAGYINKLRRQTPITIYSPNKAKKPQNSTTGRRVPPYGESKKSSDPGPVDK
jgi:parvulin-like peptidyl-prolyl isomerase